MADVVLTKYEGDFSQIQKTAEGVYNEFVKIETAGQKAFANAGKQAAGAQKQVAGLNNSVAQFARELPVIANGWGQFFISIGNQFGSLKDSVDRLNASNKELASQGMQTVSVWKAVGSAIFSVNTLISVGVTLLTVYGGQLADLVADLIKGKKSLDAFGLGFKQVTETLRDKSLANKIAEFKMLQHEVDLAQRGFADKDKTLKRYNETIGLTVGQAKSLNEAERLLIDNQDAYIKSVVARISAEQLLTKAATLRNEADASLRDEVSLTEKTLAIAAETYSRFFTAGMGKTGTIDDRISFDRLNRAEEMKKQAEGLEAQAKDLIKNQSYYTPSKEQAKQGEDELLHSLQRRLGLYKSIGRDTFETEIEIFDRRIALEKEDTIKRRDLIAERDAFIKKTNLERYEQDLKARAEYEIAISKVEADAATKRRVTKDKEWDDSLKQTQARIKELQEIEKQNYNAELDNERTSFERRREIIKKQEGQNYITKEEAVNARMELDKAETDARISQIAAVGEGISALAQLAGEDTEAGKALAVAATTIDTFVGAQRAFSAGFTVDPTGTLSTINAAVAVVSGLARVQKILSVDVPKPKKQGFNKISYEQSYKDGVIDLQGPGTTTSDSIPAWLSRGESVIKASSTAGYKDELKALNTSPLDYERLLRMKYVEPAIEAERRQVVDLADNIARSLAIHNAFSDKNIVKELKASRQSSQRDIAQLSETIENNNRQQSFEKRLYKN